MSKPLILAVETSSRLGSVALAEGPDLLAESTFSAPLTHTGELFPTIERLLHRFNRTPAQIEQLHISIGPGSFTGLRIAVSFAKMMHFAAGTQIVAVNSLDAIAANVIPLAAPEPHAHLSPSFTGGCPDNHARRPTSHDTVVVVLDAKRGQFFIAAYACRSALPTSSVPLASRSTPGHLAPSGCEPGNTIYDIRSTIYEKVLPDSLLSTQQFLNDFAIPNRPVRLLGDGLLYHKDEFVSDSIHFFDPEYWSPRASKVHLLGWRLALAGLFADPLSLQPNYVRGPDVTLKRSVLNQAPPRQPSHPSGRD